ncbi:MAG TPA: hypothetical protein PKE55_13910 [Kiritimatiellia bacterium]|nr:hypothetical protein [Kiritimatiellia bacterium]
MVASFRHPFLLLTLLGALALSTLCAPALHAQPIRTILPTETDPAITNANNRHTVLPPQGAPRNELFVFFPGTSPAIPLAYTDILRTASELGYHAISLMYPNTLSVNRYYCWLRLDLDCHENVRREVMTGADTSNLIDIPRTESIEHRLIKLLDYLHANYPSENWNQFFTSGTNLNFSAMAMGGHSQGAGYAGLFAKDHPLLRVLLIAGIDWNTSIRNQASPWQNPPHQTPIERFFGLIHRDDELVPFALATNAWALYGFDIFAPPVDVETAPGSPYAGTHILASSLGAPITNFHGAIVVDIDAPRDENNRSIYRPSWIYMLSGPTTLDPVRVTFSSALLPELQAEAIPGYSYQLETTTNLTAWLPVGPPVSATTNPPLIFTLPATLPHAAFRLDGAFEGF